MKYTVLDGTIITTHYRGYVRIDGGIRVATVLADGTAITIDDLDAGGKVIDVPDTHILTILTDGGGAQVAKIERRA